MTPDMTDLIDPETIYSQPDESELQAQRDFESQGGPRLTDAYARQNEIAQQRRVHYSDGSVQYPNAREAVRGMGGRVPENEQDALDMVNRATLDYHARRLRNAPDIMPPGQVRDVTDQYQQADFSQADKLRLQKLQQASASVQGEVASGILTPEEAQGHLDHINEALQPLNQRRLAAQQQQQQQAEQQVQRLSALQQSMAQAHESYAARQLRQNVIRVPDGQGGFHTLVPNGVDRNGAVKWQVLKAQPRKEEKEEPAPKEVHETTHMQNAKALVRTRDEFANLNDEQLKENKDYHAQVSEEFNKRFAAHAQLHQDWQDRRDAKRAGGVGDTETPEGKMYRKAALDAKAGGDNEGWRALNFLDHYRNMPPEKQAAKQAIAQRAVARAGRYLRPVEYPTNPTGGQGDTMDAVNANRRAVGLTPLPVKTPVQKAADAHFEALATPAGGVPVPKAPAKTGIWDALKDYINNGP